ncbi:MAG: hypothetical protein Q8N98_04940 [bacterium]|nr:hypothetical protein [bacterium]
MPVTHQQTTYPIACRMMSGDIERVREMLHAEFPAIRMEVGEARLPSRGEQTWPGEAFVVFRIPEKVDLSKMPRFFGEFYRALNPEQPGGGQRERR